MQQTEGRPQLAVVGSSEPLEKRQGPQPVSSLWELFFGGSSFSGYRRHTQSNFRRTSDLCRLLTLGEFPTPGDVGLWIARLRQLPGRRGKRMSQNTVGLHRDNLNAMFNWARSSGKEWTAKVGNPVDAHLCPYTRQAAVRRAIRSVDDVWPFLLASCGEGNAPDVVRRRGFLGVMRYLGIRRGEALGLSASSVQRRGGHVFVEVVAQRAPCEWVLAPPKTPRAVRTLVCRPELVKLLDAVLRLPVARVELKHGGSGEYRSVPFLFPLRDSDLAAMVAALRGVSPDDFPPGDAWHVFRHTVAVELSRRGASVEEISEWLGHVDIAHTQTYLRTLVGTRVSVSMLDYFSDETKGASPPTEEKRPARASTRVGRTASPRRSTKMSTNSNPKNPEEHP